MGNNQVWEIIKDFNCADLKIVVDPAVAVWNHQQSKIERLEREKAKVTKLVKGLRNEFDLWSDDGEGFNAIEAQIDQLEKALRGDSCE